MCNYIYLFSTSDQLIIPKCSKPHARTHGHTYLFYNKGHIFPVISPKEHIAFVKLQKRIIYSTRPDKHSRYAYAYLGRKYEYRYTYINET